MGGNSRSSARRLDLSLAKSWLRFPSFPMYRSLPLLLVLTLCCLSRLSADEPIHRYLYAATPDGAQMESARGWASSCLILMPDSNLFVASRDRICKVASAV